MAIQCSKCGRLKSKTGTHACPTSSWNKGSKGLQVAWNKGKKAKESTKLKLSETRKKKIASGEIQKAVGKLNGMYGKKPWNKGVKTGKPSWISGRKVPKEIVAKTSGANHYNWKGGKASLNMRIRKCYEYRQWVQDVLKRDNYTCLECSQRGGRLEVHHIKQFALIVKQNKISCLGEALICNELWNFENAMTLCQPCHKKTDTYLKMV